LFLCLVLMLLIHAQVYAQNQQIYGSFTVGDSEQFNLWLSDSDYYPPAFKVISNSALSNVVTIDIGEPEMLY